MITLFNRKELTITYQMEKQAKIRAALSQGGIDYRVKVVNRKSPSALSAGTRARTGSFGENPALSYEYIFYVKRSDYAAALALAEGSVTQTISGELNR